MLPLTAEIKAALIARADPDKAIKARAYMKSEMPFHGVAAPDVMAVCKAVFPQYPFLDQRAWQDAMLDLWRCAEFREERYVAENLAAVRAYRIFQTPKTLPVYREMIVDGAWWDLVDGIVNRLGELLTDHNKVIRPKVVAWSRVRNVWQRRAAIICQLKLKQATDEDLLFTAIEPNMQDAEFFIRKAIGWAMRTYSNSNPEAVIRFVERHHQVLSPLSKKEAYKTLLKNGIVSTVP